MNSVQDQGLRLALNQQPDMWPIIKADRHVMGKGADFRYRDILAVFARRMIRTTTYSISTDQPSRSFFSSMILEVLDLYLEVLGPCA